MSTSPYLQYFEGPAKRGLRSIRAGHEAAIGLALIYASIGASLGIVSGTAIAVRVFPSNAPTSMSDLAQASASVAGLNNTLKTIASQIPALQSQPTSEAANLPATPHAQVAVEAKSVNKTLTMSPSKTAHKHIISNSLEVAEEASTDARESVAAIVPPTAEEAPSNEVATAVVPVATPRLMIEGDATVADYDSTTGLVETHEGKSFSIGASAGVSSSWDEYSGHVHYRCDGVGNCTLSRAGVVVPHARLAT